MLHIGIVNKFKDLVELAERNIITKMDDNRVRTEPSITDRLAQQLESLIDGYGEIKGYKISIATLRDRGPNSEENRYGADLYVILEVQLENFQITKGFLTQAKDAKAGVDLGIHKTISFTNQKEFERLKKQVDKMLAITPDSYVFVYSTKGFMVVPAISVKGLDSLNRPLLGKPIGDFFADFLRCFVGDARLNDFENETLDRLIKEKEEASPLVLKIKISETEPVKR